MKKENVNKNIKTILFDLFICLISGIIVGFAYYLFSTPNDFAPGGVSGIASILYYLSGWNMGYFMIICNTPIFILVCIFVSKKTGIKILYGCELYVVDDEVNAIRNPIRQQIT